MTDQRIGCSNHKSHELLMKFTEAKNTNFTIGEDDVC
jgi:hypothetical protein